MSLYMRRALELARHGELRVSPNPMVGAVIVAPDGRIIGEGYHRRCGEAHAEVNAIASVSPEDAPLLGQATMYVTLEPCSHYGKTPPCADLIVSKGIGRVVVATLDPFDKVSGRGVAKLRDAGIEVEVGDMEQQARELNRRFMTAHTLRRPFITLKWAQSADGCIDGRDGPSDKAAAISSPLTQTAVHRLRALHDAILVGSGTWLADAPSLTVRYGAGRSPLRLVYDRRGRIQNLPSDVVRLSDEDLSEAMKSLYRDRGITSVLVEGGRELLQAFIDSRLYDDIIIETNPSLTLAEKKTTTLAPCLDV